MNKKVEENLISIARDLPPAYWYANGKLKGETIINGKEYEHLREDFKKKKIKVDADKFYPIANLLRYKIDHFKKLKSAYEAKGRIGVAEYILPYVSDKEYAESLTKEIQESKTKTLQK